MNRLILVLVLLISAVLANAQPPCDVPPPPEAIFIGTSACIQVCPGDFVTLALQGSLPGPQAVPVLIMEAGCLTQHCETECTPIAPPEGLIFGGDPFYPDDYFGQSPCLRIYLHWVHDSFWSFEIFSDTCAGCFCVTFDYQLSVSGVDFAAVPGDRQVELRWATRSESNNDHFEVTRDGEPAAEVRAGNLPTGSTYAWTDRQLGNGTVYRYALSAVDASGMRQVLSELATTPRARAAAITEYALQQNYPNPFNAQTSITFDLVQGGAVALTVYDMVGRRIATLLDGSLDAGRHIVSFDADKLPSGMYLYRLEVNGFATQRKLLLLK